MGIGGGGDVVGAIGVAELARARGAEAVVGGMTWERRVVDPLPGPRRLGELTGIEPLNAATALAGPAARGPGGFRFAEAGVALVRGEPTLLVDPGGGPAAVATGLAGAADALGCDAVVLLDVGGDALAHGHEPGLASPLCDAVMLAAGARLAAERPVLGAVFGVACDGELTVAEVLERLAAVAAAGGGRGAWGLTPEAAAAVQAGVDAVPTEASAQALACARGALGPATIRRGRTTVQRSPLGALTFFFDVPAAVAATARLAAAVDGARSLEDANDRLHAVGVRTELDFEREHAPPG